MSFSFKKLKIPAVMLIEISPLTDERGSFAEFYKYTDFSKAGIKKQILQLNYSKSGKNVLRGLHYQKNPMAQGKVIKVISGEIFDVALDLRKGSPHYGQWVGERLSSMGNQMIYVPEGFAHGFCVLSKTAEVIYYCTNMYSREHERGVIWNDPKIKIDWPVKNPIISQKDSSYPVFDKIDSNFTYNE